MYLAISLIALLTVLKKLPKRFLICYFGGSVFWSVRDGQLKVSTLPGHDELCLYEYLLGGESHYHFCRGWACDTGAMQDQRAKVHDTVLVLNVATRVGTHQKGSAVLNAGAGGLCDDTNATCLELACLIEAFLGLRQGSILPQVSGLFDDFSTIEFTGSEAVVIVVN